ncbi:MAG TPA: O-antigen ligase family protein [Candidatus Polarisedimenticolia bacterium]|nr:O-antigen ligase family protein [Candidatus Polarisedimenticolia bacterium]
MSGLVAEAGIHALVLFAPLAFGGVEGWALGVIQIIAGIVAAAWAVGRLSGPRPGPRPPGGVWIPVLLFAALAGVTMVPLPSAWIAALSPGVHAFYETAVPGYAQGRPFQAAELVPWLLSDQAERLPPAQGDTSPLLDPPLASSGLPLSVPARRTLSIYPFATRQQLLLLLCYLAVFGAACDRFDRRERLLRLARVGVFAAALVSLIGILMKATGTRKFFWVREASSLNIFGPFVDRNTYAAFAGFWLAVALCMVLFVLGRRGRPVRPGSLAFWGGAAVLMIAGIFLSLSRGGILTAALVTILAAVFGLARGGPKGAPLGLGAMLAAALLLVVWIGPERVLERIGTLSAGSRVPSLQHRVEAWSRTGGLIQDHLLLGTGLGTFRFAFMRYAPPGEGWWTTAHNEPLELLCDTGLAGGALFLWGLVAFLRRAARPGRLGQGEDGYLWAGLALGVAGLVLHSCVTSNLQIPANALTLALGGAGLWNTSQMLSARPSRSARPRPVPEPGEAAAS